MAAPKEEKKNGEEKKDVAAEAPAGTVSRVSPLEAIRSRVEAKEMREQFLRALPKQIDGDRFIRVFLTTLSMNPEIAECTQRSVLGAIMKAAQDGLLLDGREAAVVIFKNNQQGTKEAQYLPMVAGILKKMRQSGEIASVSAHVIKANDYFEFQLGDEEKITHRPSLTDDRGAIIGAYAVVKTLEGGVYREIVSLAQIQKAQAVSKAKKGPWLDWNEEMAEKTVLKKIAKRCPSSTDLQMVIDHDNEVTGIDTSALAAPAANPALPGRPKALQQILDKQTGEVTDAPTPEPDLTPAGEPDPDDGGAA